ncbi:MAG: type IV pilus twitching motility protein PilT [Eubacteriales bacterium]
MSIDIINYLKRTIEIGASDLHVTVGHYISMRIDGKLEIVGDKKLTPEDTFAIAEELLNEKQMEALKEKGDIDFSFAIKDVGRFRINAFRQRGTYSMALRAVSLDIPTLEELKLPQILKDLTHKKRGMIIFTGPTGSGKSTSLASMIDIINRQRSEHILTLEDPIEYLHKHNKCIVNQREYGSDFQSFPQGLRASLRQDPDIILLGEMRDLESVEIALTAAETGHLLFSTLHTIGAAATIDRIIDVFPPHQQQQVSVQLANVLVAVVSQQLMVKKEGGRVVSTEVMITTPAIKNLIREKKTHQIQNAIQTGTKYGMHTMDNDLLRLYRNNTISKETVMQYGIDSDYLKRYLI